MNVADLKNKFIIKEIIIICNDMILIGKNQFQNIIISVFYYLDL